MTDNPLDRIPSHDRVSLRAVVVSDGEDPGPALAAAGITDPIAVPIVFGEGEPSVAFGDGVTPNLTAVLEFDQEEDGNSSSSTGRGFGTDGFDYAAGGQDFRTGAQAGRAQKVNNAAGSAKTDTVMLPAAYGVQPLAPVRRSGQ